MTYNTYLETLSSSPTTLPSSIWFGLMPSKRSINTKRHVAHVTDLLAGDKSAFLNSRMPPARTTRAPEYSTPSPLRKTFSCSGRCQQRLCRSTTTQTRILHPSIQGVPFLVVRPHETGSSTSNTCHPYPVGDAGTPRGALSLGETR